MSYNPTTNTISVDPENPVSLISFQRDLVHLYVTAFKKAIDAGDASKSFVDDFDTIKKYLNWDGMSKLNPSQLHKLESSWIKFLISASDLTPSLLDAQKGLKENLKKEEHLLYEEIVLPDDIYVVFKNMLMTDSEQKKIPPRLNLASIEGLTKIGNFRRFIAANNPEVGHEEKWLILYFAALNDAEITDTVPELYKIQQFNLKRILGVYDGSLGLQHLEKLKLMYRSYLARGNAPARRLQKHFDVYQMELKRAGQSVVGLNDEIIRFFDNALASNAEIEDKRAHDKSSLVFQSTPSKKTKKLALIASITWFAYVAFRHSGYYQIFGMTFREWDEDMFIANLALPILLPLLMYHAYKWAVK